MAAPDCGGGNRRAGCGRWGNFEAATSQRHPGPQESRRQPPAHPRPENTSSMRIPPTTCRAGMATQPFREAAAFALAHSLPAISSITTSPARTGKKDATDAAGISTAIFTEDALFCDKWGAPPVLSTFVNGDIPVLDFIEIRYPPTAAATTNTKRKKIQPAPGLKIP